MVCLTRYFNLPEQTAFSHWSDGGGKKANIIMTIEDSRRMSNVPFHRTTRTLPQKGGRKGRKQKGKELREKTLRRSLEAKGLLPSEEQGKEESIVHKAKKRKKDRLSFDRERDLCEKATSGQA